MPISRSFGRICIIHTFAATPIIVASFSQFRGWDRPRGFVFTVSGLGPAAVASFSRFLGLGPAAVASFCAAIVRRVAGSTAVASFRRLCADGSHLPPGGWLRFRASAAPGHLDTRRSAGQCMEPSVAA